jgi:hypothetical protein
MYRLQNDVSTLIDEIHGFEQPNRALDRRGTEVHVALRRREIPMAGEFLNGSWRRTTHREMRTERMA